MSGLQRDPAAVGRPRPGRTTDWRPDHTTARCELHGCAIVDRLPAGCPLAQGGREAVHRLYHWAWRLIANPDLQAFPGQGHELLQRFEVCFRCEAHRAARVRYLLEAPPKPAPAVARLRPEVGPTNGTGRRREPAAAVLIVEEGVRRAR